MVTAAAALLAVLVMVMLMVVVTAAAALLTVLVMMLMVVVMMLMLFFQQFQRLCQSILALNGFQQLGAGELIPGGSDDDGGGILFTQQCHAGIQLVLLHALGAAEDDGAGVFYLIVVELTEVLHVHLALVGICHGGEAVEFYVVHLQTADCGDDIAELAHAGGFDEDAVGGVGLHHLGQRLGKIAHQAAADAAAVHFGDLHAGFLQETAVDADLAELVFDQHQLFALVGFFHQFFDEGGFTGTQKAGENINFSHIYHSFSAGGR